IFLLLLAEFGSSNAPHLPVQLFSQEHLRLGTGLVPLGSSPIQNTVVPIPVFHGKRSPACEGAKNKWRGANTSESIVTIRSYDNLSDFLLALILLGGALLGAECAKSDEIDDSNTANV